MEPLEFGDLTRGALFPIDSAPIKERRLLRGLAVQCAKIAKSSSATMLVILIAGLTAGPAVSL
jgi:hypothetical protein